MTFSIVQFTNGGLSLTFGSDQTLNNLNVVWFLSDDSTFTLSTPTDTQGNVYTQVFLLAAGGGTSFMQAWISPGIKAGPNTITTTVASGTPPGFGNLYILEISGCATSNAVDQSQVRYQPDNGFGSQTATTNNMPTTTNANDILLCYAGGPANATAPGSGYTQIGGFTGPSSGYGIEYQVVSSTGDYAGTWTMAASPYIIGVMALKSFQSPASSNVQGDPGRRIKQFNRVPGKNRMYPSSRIPTFKRKLS